MRIPTPLSNSCGSRSMRAGRRSIPCACSPTSAAGSTDRPSRSQTSTNNGLTTLCTTATALRSFFRFLLQCGAIATDLARAVPTVPNWRLASLPRFMKAEDVDYLLHSCERSTPKGQRDYAILLLLARLGLRAGEVVAL